ETPMASTPLNVSSRLLLILEVKIGVVEPRAVGPGERAVYRSRSEREPRVRIRHQTVTCVLRQCADWTGCRRARRISVADNTHTAATGQTRIGGLCPGGAPLERKVHA